MSGEPVLLGPFKDGIRLGMLGNPDSTTDATDIVNMDLMFDGSLKSRRQQKSITVTNPGGASRLDPVGKYVASNGQVYVFFTTTTGTYYWTGGSSLTLVTTGKAAFVSQYQDYAWIVCYEGASGKWIPPNTFTVVTGMPLGNSSVIKNDRLLIAGLGSDGKVSYSKAGDFNSWEGAGGGSFLVRPQDGGFVVRLANYNDQVLVFKTTGIWILQFTADPGTGNLRLISPTVGTANRDTVAVREDVVIFYFNGKVYGVTNNTLQDLSRPLMDNLLNNVGTPAPLMATGPSLFADAGVAMTLFMTFLDHNKVILYINGLYWVYHLDSGSWTRYVFDTNPIGKVIEVRNFTSTTEYTYFTGGVQSFDPKLYELVHPDTTGLVAAGTGIAFTCSIRTKGLVYGASHSYKRLFHWGVDGVFIGNVTGTMIPLTTQNPVKWSDLVPKKWNELNTWRSPLGYSVNVVSNSYSSAYNTRTYVKFPRSARFRRIVFDVKMDRKDSYCILFTITSFIAVRQLVFAKET